MATVNLPVVLPMPAHVPLQVAYWPLRGHAAAQALVEPWLRARLGDAPIERNPHGRPGLPAGQGHDIGWSHSGDALLAATGRGLRLGVDVERLRPRPRALELAARFFHPDSAAWLRAQPDLEDAFVRLWCAHEAVLKAHGRGIAFGLHRLAFEGDDQGMPRLARVDPQLGDAGDWRLHAFVPAPGLHAALAWRPAY